MSPALFRPDTFTSTISLDTLCVEKMPAGDANVLHRGGQTSESLGSRLRHALSVRLAAHRGPLVAGLVGLLSAGGTAVFFDASLDADQRRHMDSFGRAIAEQLATLGAEPMIGGDRISLSVLASRMNEPSEVAAVSIYTVDDRVLAITGSAPSNAPHFTHPIVFEDTVAGYARVALNPAVFRTGPQAVPLTLWILGSAVASLLAGYLASRSWAVLPIARRRRPQPDDDVNKAEDDDPQPSYVLVINWFNQVSFAPPDRIRVIDMCLSRAEQVGALYGARATELPGTGLLLAFNSAPTETATSERCFQIICGALLVAEVMSTVNERQFMQGRPDLEFRFGLHEDPTSTPVDRLVGADCTTDTILLSAVAGNGSVAVSREIFDRLEQPERFRSSTEEHMILAALTTATSGRCTIVSALQEAYRALIDQQVERLLDQPSG